MTAPIIDIAPYLAARRAPLAPATKFALDTQIAVLDWQMAWVRFWMAWGRV